MGLKKQAGPFVTAGILAGGGSRRFGRDKAHYPLRGRSLVQWTVDGARCMTDEIFILAKNEDAFRLNGTEVLTDSSPVSTPLNGIRSVIPRVHHWLLLLACDIPFFGPEVLELLWENRSIGEATVIRTEGRYHPFPALYPLAVLPLWEEALRTGTYHLQRTVERMPRRILTEDDLLSRGIRPEALHNINTPEDLKRFMA